MLFIFLSLTFIFLTIKKEKQFGIVKEPIPIFLFK